MTVKPELTPRMVRQIVGRDDALILEIGANDGTDTAGFLESFPRGIVHCFECDPRAISEWEKRIGDNQRAHVYELALSDTTGTATFHQSGGKPHGKCWEHVTDWNKSGSLLEVDQHCKHSPWLRFNKTIQVRTMRLDDWATVNLPTETVDFAWADVQGAEHLVFRGGQEVLKRTRWVYHELDPRRNYKNDAKMQDIIATLPGFRLVSEHGGYNYLWKNEVI